MQTKNLLICALLCLTKFRMDLGFATMNLPSPGLNIHGRAVNNTSDFNGFLSSQHVISCLNAFVQLHGRGSISEIGSPNESFCQSQD